MLRVAVVDVGSTSAHVDVLELRRGRPPAQPVTVKHKVSLSRELGPDGRIHEKSVTQLVKAVGRAADTASLLGAQELLAFVTSSVRDAPNREAVLARVAEASGVRLGFLTPRQEAQLTYEGVHAWRRRDDVGTLMVADIGGGTMELALGTGSRATSAVSAPLGARRLTLTGLPGDLPRPRDVSRLRKRIRRELPGLLERLGPLPKGTLHVGSSRIFAQLAALTAVDQAVGEAALDRERLRALLPTLAAMTWQERARLPGVSRSRAPHILAGALVAEALMDCTGLSALPVCPWGLREGIALRLQAGLRGASRATDGLDHLRQPA